MVDTLAVIAAAGTGFLAGTVFTMRRIPAWVARLDETGLRVFSRRVADAKARRV